MKKNIIFILIANFAIIMFGCESIKKSNTEKIDLSSGITIYVDKEGAVSINNKKLPVEKTVEKLLKLNVKPSDVIIIKVSRRASQRPVLNILDQLGDAKFQNITITNDK